MSIQQLFFNTGASSDKIVASGGIVYTKGDWKVHIFLSSGTFTVNQINDGTTNAYFALADGGNAGVNGSNATNNEGAGGGDAGTGGNYNAGASLVQFSSLFSSTGNYSVTVGAAGSASSLNTSAGTQTSNMSGGAAVGGGGGGIDVGQNGDPGGCSSNEIRLYWWPAPDYSDFSDLSSGGASGGGGGSYTDGVSSNGGGGGNCDTGSGGSGGSSPDGYGNNGSTASATEYRFGFGGSGGGGQGGFQGAGYASGGLGSAGASGGVLIKYKYK